ncbi:DUF1203 domain-containing protein [Streptomyces sp. R1]|uniref:DUF1203 domain-containing protein n=1 Tax=Streptomyces sp. R1 TaxID=1509279 RepID=UPI001E387C1F|nr:DUF1203 domain-containing protein [Streptomyces sp. R1]MCC8339811.1 DUF1203 domain-containing protein [Streptomyces sp. R1]
MNGHTAHPIPPGVLKELRATDDAGRVPAPVTDDEGGAPLRRRAAATGADPGPYDEQGPVFVHAEECAGPETDGLPFTNSHRVLRRYSAHGHILGGRLIGDPGAFGYALREAFDDPAVAFVHVRAVEYGCFLYEVTRG